MMSSFSLQKIGGNSNTPKTGGNFFLQSIHVLWALLKIIFQLLSFNDFTRLTHEYCCILYLVSCRLNVPTNRA